tara:strand:- start:20232 stop:20984 length:753 start_codon:yes stop_codon:yes gene_type:complete
MSRRDDMVIAPNIGDAHKPTAKARSRVDRMIADQTNDTGRGGGSVLRKLRTARHLAKRRTRMRAVKAGRMKQQFARQGARAAGRAGAGLAGRAAGRGIATPVGAIVAGLIVVGVVAVRIATDRPLEGLGEDLNRMFLGDADDEARASTAARKHLTSNAHVMMTAKHKGAREQLGSVYDDIYSVNLRTEKAASKFREMFPVNNVFDMMIKRVEPALRAVVKTWSTGSLAQEAFRKLVRLASNQPNSKSSGR